MKYGRLAIVTDYATVVLPEKIESWINEPVPKYKEGGRRHKESIKRRSDRVRGAVDALSQIAWVHGNDVKEVEKALSLLVKNPRNK